MGYSSTGEKADRAINRHSADSRQRACGGAEMRDSFVLPAGVRQSL
jgi:hypothetical protein